MATFPVTPLDPARAVASTIKVEVFFAATIFITHPEASLTVPCPSVLVRDALTHLAGILASPFVVTADACRITQMLQDGLLPTPCTLLQRIGDFEHHFPSRFGAGDAASIKTHLASVKPLFNFVLQKYVEPFAAR